MEDTTWIDHIHAAHADREASKTLHPLAHELWDLREDGTPVEEVTLQAAAELGQRYVERGYTASSAVREVLELGRALVSGARERNDIDEECASRLHALVDQAAWQTALGVERARRARRQSWLSFLVHEIKNPLNTVLNALWLLREKGADRAQAVRFVELAERAVRRLESRARDLRQLDEELLTPPPGWQAPSKTDTAT
jgi:signal transduction histidine kinase